jgi:phage regulator Rha-like protein
MTSLEIAELTGKQHKDVLKAIRNMEPAWTKTCGRKFALTSRIIEQPNGGTREVPCYSLTKTECLYIATKFNDEARAKLVIRWEELERQE